MESPPPSRIDRPRPMRRARRGRWAGRFRLTCRLTVTAPAANPILLIGTRFDPIRSLANAQLAERRLGNEVLLTHDGYGHLGQSDPSAWVMQVLGSYFVDLTMPPRGTICPSDHLPFDPNFGQLAPSR